MKICYLKFGYIKSFMHTEDNLWQQLQFRYRRINFERREKKY